MRAAWFVGLLLAACSVSAVPVEGLDGTGDTSTTSIDDTDSPVDTSDSSPPVPTDPCLGPPVVRTSPVPDAADVFGGDTLIIEFAEAARDTDIALYAGTITAEVPDDATPIPLETVRWTPDGRVAWAAPTSLLTPSSTYTIVVRGACSEGPRVPFRVLDPGDPPARLDGTFLLDAASVDLILPRSTPGLADTAPDRLLRPVWRILGDSGTTFTTFAGMFDALGTLEQPCLPTTTQVGAREGSALRFTETDAIASDLDVASAPPYAFGPWFAGFAPTTGSTHAYIADGGDTLVGLSLDALVDVRDPATTWPALGVTTRDEACAALGTWGISCQACPDGESSCVRWRWRNGVAHRAPRTLVQVTPGGFASGCPTIP